MPSANRYLMSNNGVAADSNSVAPQPIATSNPSYGPGNNQHNVLPPMPSAASLHETTVNHLLAYGNAPSSASSAAVSWYGGAGQQHPSSAYDRSRPGDDPNDPSAKRSPRSITTALSQAEVEAIFVTEQLKQDYETLRSMTLLDDETELDTLFMRHSNFSKPNFLYNFLFNRYDRKYRDLFERYPGTVYWLTFCLSTLITRSEGTLASVCSGNTAAGAILRPVRMPLFDTFTVSLNRRARKERQQAAAAAAAAAANDNKKTDENETADAAKTASSGEDGGSSGSANSAATKRSRGKDDVGGSGHAKRVSSSHDRPTHPFYRISISLTNRNLFEIGRMTEHCVPPEFGVLFVHARPGVCVKINTSADRVPLNGIRGTLSRPVIAPLVSRQNRGFTFIHLHYTDSLVQMMCRMAEASAGSNTTVNLGTKLTMRVDNLAQSVVSRGEKFSEHKGPVTLDTPPFLTAINQFQCTMLSGNLLDVKAYSDTVYRIGSELAMRNDERQLFEETYQETKEELLDELERYQDALEEYEAE